MKRLNKALPVALMLFPTVSFAQELISELSVNVTEADGLYTYEYTISNAAESEVPVSFFSFSAGVGAVIEDISGPDDWTAVFDETQMDFQTLFIAGDGITCAVPDFDIRPDQSASFTLVSPWGPELQEFSYGKLTDDCIEFVGFPTGGFVVAPSIPSMMRNPGDIDGDGDVDSSDRTILTTNWTGALDPLTGGKTFEDGDFDGDGDVDSVDQTSLITNWTGAMQLASPDAGSIVVPEPSSLALCLLGLLALPRKRRQ